MFAYVGTDIAIILRVPAGPNTNPKIQWTKNGNKTGHAEGGISSMLTLGFHLHVLFQSFRGQGCNFLIILIVSHESNSLLSTNY